MGHKLNETQAAYFRASPEKLREIYLKYVPYLTIQKALNISESPEYQKIKNENQILANETARHVVERKELQDLRSELEKANIEKSKMKARLKSEMKSQVEMVKVEVLSQLSRPAILKTLSTQHLNNMTHNERLRW